MCIHVKIYVTETIRVSRFMEQNSRELFIFSIAERAAALRFCWL